MLYPLSYVGARKVIAGRPGAGRRSADGEGPLYPFEPGTALLWERHNESVEISWQ